MIPKILQVLVAQLVYTMFAHRFTCGERKIWQNIEKPQNIMKLIVVYVVVASSKEFSSAEIFFSFFFQDWLTKIIVEEIVALIYCSSIEFENK